jgi:hypothetical protein
MAKSRWPEVQEKLPLIKAWARDGIYEKDIIVRLKIANGTFYKYKNEHLELAEALKEGKEVVDVEVENIALKRALGYSYDEITTEIVTTTTGKEISRKIKKTTKHVPGEPAMIIWWLCNRKPDVWRQRQREQAGSDEGLMGEYIALLKEGHKDGS